MLKALRDKLRKLLDERATTDATIATMLDAVETEGRDAFTTEETEAFTAARAKLAELDKERTEVEARISELEAVEADREAAASARAKLGDEPAGTPSTERARVKVGTEERVYRPGARDERGNPVSFFSDAYRSSKGPNPVAEARLARHTEQEAESFVNSDAEFRDVGTSAFGALVVPQYLVDEYAQVLRNSRSVCNAVRREPLAEQGMTLNIPRGTTGTAVAAQATENSAVQETDFDETTLAVPVATYAGQQDVSRQSLERGTPGIDRLIYSDLVADYAMKLDADVLNGPGTGGRHKGIFVAAGTQSITYTDATPTVAEAWPKFADGIQQVATNRKMAATLIVMHPRRWGWLIAALDTQNRPLIVAEPSAAVNAMGTATAAAFGEGQLVGTIQGLPVLVDANVPTNFGTNEDRIIEMRRDDPILWEEGDGMPRELLFEETQGGSLTTKLVVYGYSAFTAERNPTAVSIISGTGLILPVF